jgi:hypothetical protein
MFLNANVLFKTKLIDGVSTVNRFAQTKVASTEHLMLNSIISSNTLSQELVGKTRDDELIIIEDDKLIKNKNNAFVEETNLKKTSRKRSLPTRFTSFTYKRRIVQQ